MKPINGFLLIFSILALNVASGQCNCTGEHYKDAGKHGMVRTPCSINQIGCAHIRNHSSDYVKVYIDEKFWGELSPKGEISKCVSAGNHKIKGVVNGLVLWNFTLSVKSCETSSMNLTE